MEKSIFYQPIEIHLNRTKFRYCGICFFVLKGLPGMKVDLTKRCKSVITEKVFPALEDMKTYLRDTYLPKSRPEIGVGSLPNGEEYYRECLK